MHFSCIVDMPVEQGIARVLDMKTYEAGGIGDYPQKAKVAAKALDTQNSIYVHIKGPDEFGHDGDATGKTRSIEDIDGGFFGPLLDRIDTDNVAVVVSADHSHPLHKQGSQRRPRSGVGLGEGHPPRRHHPHDRGTGPAGAHGHASRLRGSGRRPGCHASSKVDIRPLRIIPSSRRRSSSTSIVWYVPAQRASFLRARPNMDRHIVSSFFW